MGLYNKTFYCRKNILAKTRPKQLLLGIALLVDKKHTSFYVEAQANGKDSTVNRTLGSSIYSVVSGNTKGGSITVLSTSCLTGLESAA
jgi:hypothetical protein